MLCTSKKGDVVDAGFGVKDVEKELRRRSPHRKHLCTWVATDQTQLEHAERVVLKGLCYHRAIIAGLNTISTDDITRFDETPVSQRRTPPRSRGARESPSNFSDVPSEDDREIVLLVHGFCGGVGGWAQNWEHLAARYRLYAVDLPGFARSEHRSIKVETLQQSMDVFVAYLERWFAAVGFSRKVILLGHSFGCFVSAHYAMRHPERVRMIAMTEPWGVNRANPERLKAAPLPLRLAVKLFAHVSPLSLLRALGPAGPAVLKRARPDFAQHWASYLENSDAVYDYVYHCNTRRPAMGEKLFLICCHYDAASKVPLPEVLPSKLDKAIPLGILVGAESWISPGESMEMAATMAAMGFTVSTGVLEKAGHQIFTANASGFNERIVAMIEELLLASTPSTVSTPSTRSTTLLTRKETLPASPGDCGIHSPCEPLESGE